MIPTPTQQPVLVLTAIVSLVIGCLELGYSTDRGAHYEQDGRDDFEIEDGTGDDGSG
jgi:hypothetical protein